MYFSIRSLYGSTIKGNRCKVVNSKCVYRLLYSTFINKVIKFGHIIYSISLLRLNSLKQGFLKYDIKLFSLLKYKTLRKEEQTLYYSQIQSF